MLALIHAELVLHDHFMPEAVLFIEDGISRAHISAPA